MKTDVSKFSDFTYEHYRILLREGKKRFIFRTYDNFNKSEKFLLWRHDVDISMYNAQMLATIEAEENIAATYFLLLHSEFYNLLDPRISKLVNNIIKLGHKIGLHFDFQYYSVKTKEDLTKYLNIEKEIIENHFLCKVNTFSFHNPTEGCSKFQDFEYGGLINAYAEYFRNNVTYCSDSNGHWRFRRLYDVLCDNTVLRLQALTHPVWWMKEPLSPREKVLHYLNENAKNTMAYYEEALQKYGRLNIG